MQYIKRKLITWLAKNLLPLVEADELMVFDKQGGVYINGQRIKNEELSRMKIEVEAWTNSKTYQLTNKYFADLLKKKMFIQSTDITDMVFGKSNLYALSVQETIYNNIKNAKREEKKN